MAEVILKDLVEKIPNFKEKEKLVQVLMQLQKQKNELEEQKNRLQEQTKELEKENLELRKENKTLQKKYEKTNKDKLTISHLLSKVSDELEQSLNNEKRFVASVSHELRTPLTSILGYSELLKDTSLNNKQIRYLNRIVESSNHLLSLISDLLDVAKLEDNRIELSPRECDLDDILTECANLIRSRISDNIDFKVDIPLFNYTVKADDKRIKQIFINLLSNAAKFTKKGSIRFYVKDYKVEDGKMKVTVNVDDTGKGIPKEMLEKIFEPFQSTDKTQGTGLGLYITRQLANLMGGDIQVESKEGIGSNFSVTLELDIARKKEIGKALKGANVIMFAPKSDFSNQVAREFFTLGVNFQNPCINQNDPSTLLAQMVIGGKTYELGIIDQSIFGYHTNNVAGTFRSINKNIKLVVIADEDSDLNFSEFDLVLNRPISAQRFIKSIEGLYSSDSYNGDDILDFSELKVLVVEDVDINREYEKEMLDNFFSIQCDTAVNGKEAVEKAKNNKYDIILMDIRMPVMDGLEATRKIREFDRETPIICMSANVYKEDKQAAKEAGMNEFIEKPLEKADIEDKFKKVLLHSYSTISSEDGKPKLQTAPKVQEKDLKEQVLDHLKERFSEEIAKRLYQKGLESVQNYLERIKNHIENKDTAELAEDYHALKGVLANIGLKKYSKLSSELEQIAKDGKLIDIIDLNKELVSALSELVKKE
jgi:signal transduction histidine kinase/CheY-like chemotaxis protein